MEIIPKESSKPFKGSNILLYFSLVLLFFSVAGFFILNHFVERSRKELAVLESVLTEAVTEEKELAIKKALGYQKIIDDFSFLIEQQLESSRFFVAFEKVVHPQVWFSKIELNLKEKRVVLSGQAQNFKALGQQLFIIQNEKDLIKDVSLETVSIAEGGGVDFGLLLILNPKIFND